MRLAASRSSLHRTGRGSSRLNRKPGVPMMNCCVIGHRGKPLRVLIDDEAHRRHERQAFDAMRARHRVVRCDPGSDGQCDEGGALDLEGIEGLVDPVYDAGGGGHVRCGATLVEITHPVEHCAVV